MSDPLDAIAAKYARQRRVLRAQLGCCFVGIGVLIALSVWRIAGGDAHAWIPLVGNLICLVALTLVARRFWRQ